VNSAWQNEIWRIAGLVLAGALFGYLVGNVALGVVLVLTVHIGWHLYNLNRLVRWLQEGKKFQPPEAKGIWDDVFEHIFRLQQRNRKRKRNLRSMLKRFHKITVALPDATVELRPASEEIEWWNNAAAKFLGFEYPRDVGQRISNLLRHPEFLTYLHGKDYDQPIEIPSPVDENIRLRVRIIPYSGDRRLLVARDMTRMQLLERTRRDFVANVSHELRTPLTVVAGYIETLMDSPECGGEFGPQLRSMQLQTARMNRIVEDLIMLSRLESEMPRVDSKPVNVAQLIESVVEQARELSGQEGHEFVLDIASEVCLKGRESELYSAFSNLVFNAVRYTPAGGRISIRWTDSETGPEFSVADSGVGIAPTHIPRITERFYRVDAGRSRARGGTGLGLAIVKHVVLRHQGQLEIDSELEKGSVFRCRFAPERRVACGSSAGTDSGL